MALSRLNLTHFRNLNELELEPHTDGFNLISGKNGSGKTGFLEAIYFLSMGRSFRCSFVDRIISNERDYFSIFAQIKNHQQHASVGVERHRDKTAKIRLNGENQSSIAELAQLIPVRLINSQSYSLLDGGPLFRRKYIDWGLFYLKAEFLFLWQRFERALKQRNAALRSQLSRSEVDVWTKEFIEASLLFDTARQEYLQLLTPVLKDIMAQLLDTHLDIQIEYQCGWKKDEELAFLVGNSYFKDAALGYTQYGPHKADLKVNIHGVSAKDFLSRGQQKLFVCAMILAQGKLLSSIANKRPIFLVDDLPSELDSSSLQKVVAMLEKLASQVFITTIEPNAITKLSKESIKMFHVEHGKVIQGLI